MKQKFGACVQCEKENQPINSKGVCRECVYLNNHGETRLESVLRKEREKPKKIYEIKRKPLRSSRKRSKNNTHLKNERLERRRIQIEKDEKTYEEVFNSRPHECEECGTPLPDQFRDENGMVIFRTQYSHIMTKGTHKEFRNNSKNFNRFCNIHHDQWEFGDREEMRTYESNKKIIEQLLKERNE